MGVYRISATKNPQSTMSGQTVNVWHLTSDTNAIPDVQKGITALVAFYDALKAESYGGNAWNIGASVTRIDVKPPTFMATTPGSSLPTGTLPFFPAQVAWVISWKTIFAGRSYRGRTYFGPLVASACDTAGFATATATTHVNSAIAAIVNFNNTNGPGLMFGVYSTETGGAIRPTPVNTPIVTGSFNGAPRTQRRRVS